jgi:hypothetical protein
MVTGRLFSVMVSLWVLAGCGGAEGGVGSGSSSEEGSLQPAGSSTPVGSENPSGAGMRLANGGFEEPEVGSYEFFDDEFAGWTVAQGSVEIVSESYGEGYRARSGDQVLALNGYRAGGVRQEVRTEPGERYRLVFYLTADPNAKGFLTLRASAGSASRSYELTPSLDSFRREVLEFEGASGSQTTRIEFTSTSEGTEERPFVDDVSVAPVEMARGRR